jgi:outer membrane biosynthesis protein TonB
MNKNVTALIVALILVCVLAWVVMSRFTHQPAFRRSVESPRPNIDGGVTAVPTPETAKPALPPVETSVPKTQQPHQPIGRPQRQEAPPSRAPTVTGEPTVEPSPPPRAGLPSPPPDIEKPLQPLSIPETPIAPLEGAVPAPARPTIAPPPSTAATPSTNPEFAAVQRVVTRYEQIYDQLDANAVASIWPSVDTPGLARLFARIRRQDLHFDSCVFAVVESHATATCTGSLTYVPRVGNGAPRTERHAWSIELERAGEGWQIAAINAR